MSNIEIYTQDWCPFCTRAKQVFDGRGVAYTEINAPRGSEARAEAARRCCRQPDAACRQRRPGGNDKRGLALPCPECQDRPTWLPR